jgi:hypothetical protein
MKSTELLPDVAAIHEEATQAAIAAETAYKAQYGEPYYCGFAWVNIWGIRANSKIGKEIAKFCKKDYTGAFCVWNPGKTATQSMDVKEQGAYAYAKVWEAHGFKAYAGSRAD